MAAAPRQLFVVFARAFATVVTVATSASDVALVVVVVVVALSSSLPRGGMTRRWRVVREAEKRRNKSNNKTHERVETKVEVVAVALKQKRVKGVKVVGSGGCCARARRRREREKGTVFLFDASCFQCSCSGFSRENTILPHHQKIGILKAALFSTFSISVFLVFGFDDIGVLAVPLSEKTAF